MVLHHTGSEGELVYCSTPCLSVSIKGAETPVPLLHPTQKEANLSIVSNDDFEITLSGDAEMALSECFGMTHTACFRSHPVFFEQKRYELIIEPSEGHTVEFWHENYHIRNKISQVGRNRKLLSGIIGFGNDIGFSDLVFIVDGHQYLKITIEVFPSKIGYKDDYREIVTDVTNEVYNLVFDFLRRTYSSFDSAPSGNSSPVEFFAIIQKVYSEYISAADIVLRSPHHVLMQEAKVISQRKIRRFESKTLRWLENHPNHMTRNSDRVLFDKALAVQKHVTYDTRENRLVKYMLEQTARRLDQFRRLYSNASRDTDSEILKRIDAMVAGIKRRCDYGFMKEVTPEPSNSGMSLVFCMAPGYRKLYRCYLLLQHGLSVTGSIFDVSLKDLSVLYEYWCFIKLNRLMKEKYELISQDIISTSGTSLFVSLTKGRSSHVRYKNRKTGETITLFYNPKEVNAPTVTQRPDNVLSLKKSGAETEYEYVFDAKYRINPSIPGTDYYERIANTPGPEIDDINTMHRYRDAIVYQSGVSPFQRIMFGAYVLFPYANEEEYRHHRFYESIEKVNVGGLPFLPSATGLVSNLLDDLINDSSESAFERITLPKGIESRLKKVDWERRDVLIGTIRSREQLEVCLNNRFYYIPVTRIAQEKLPIHEVAIYQSRGLFGKTAGIEYFGEVLALEKVKRRDITEFPRESDALYYRITVKEWEKLKHRIETQEYGIRTIAFTNGFLLRHCTKIPELFLKTAEEYRFLTELKRFASDATKIDDDRITGFEFGSYKAVFEDGEIKLYGETGMIAHCLIADFIRRPSANFKGLMRKMHQ